MHDDVIKEEHPREEYPLHHLLKSCSPVGDHLRGQSSRMAFSMVEDLCDNGAAVEKQDKYGLTPLWMAARYCRHSSVIDLLCNRGANVNHDRGDFPKGVQKYRIQPPLHTSLEFNNIEVIEALIRNGADCTLRSQSGESVFGGLAARCDWIIDRAAEPDLDFYMRATEMLKNDGARFEIKNDAGDTVLHLAAKRNNSLAMTAFLKHGADPYVKNNKGHNVLDIAIRDDNWGAVYALNDAGVDMMLNDRLMQSKIKNILKFREAQTMQMEIQEARFFARGRSSGSER